MAFDAVLIQCFGHIREPVRGIGKLAARMTTMAEGAGDALPMNLILFPELVGRWMTGLAFRRMVGRVANEDEDEIDGKKYPCHPDTD